MLPPLQSANASASNAHVVEMGAPAVVNVNAGGGLTLVTPGPPVIVTVGAIVSVVHDAVADATLVAASIATIWSAWGPFARPGVVNAVAHGTGAAVSSLQVTEVAPETVNVIAS